MSEENKDTAEQQENTQSIADHKQTDVGQETKTFTQADVDKIISERLKRERDKLPNDDDLKAYKEWKKSQQSESEKAAEREKEFQALQSKSIELERENAVIKAGVKADDAEFVIFKVSRMEGDFKKNLESFLSENKKFTEPVTETVAGTKHTAGKGDPDAASIAAFRKAAGLK